MKYIVWGCGHTGKMALDFLGYHRVLCFASSKPEKGYEREKRIINYEQMIRFIHEDSKIIIVIASEKYHSEMEKKLQEEHIEKYFIFQEEDTYKLNEFFPQYYLYKKRHTLSYTEILSRYDLNKYSRILVYGVNGYVHYLIAEIMEIAPKSNIVIIETDHNGKYFSLGLPCENSYVLDESSVLIINIPRNKDDIRERVRDANIIDIYEIDSLVPAFTYDGIRRFKSLHKDERIFVIGNGPSLNYRDLDKLLKNNEVCIASNKIYKAFEKTEWRPDYLIFEDGRVIEAETDTIRSLVSNLNIIMADSYHYERNEQFSNVTYFHHIPEQYYPNYPGFSNDAEKGLFAGYTITYTGIQLAAYIGAKEIYLLGVDHSFIGHITDSCNHFIGDYFKYGEKELYHDFIAPSYEEMTKAYEKAEVYSRQNGFRIYNATRGGKLEVFERVNFDDLF